MSDRDLSIEKKSLETKKVFLLTSILGISFLLLNAFFWFGYSDRKISLAFSLFSILLVSILGLVTYANQEEKQTSSRLFLLVLIILGVFFTFVFTPLSIPDEDYHFTASYSLSNFILGKGYQSQDPLLMRVDDSTFYHETSVNLSLSEYTKISEGLSNPFVSSDREIWVTTGRSHALSGNLPQSKIASALGITLARLLGLSSYYLFYFGRLANLAVYIVLVYSAFKIAPVGKNAIVVTSLLPMSLHLAASYSYDAFIIPMSIFLTALCLRSIYKKGRIAISELAQLTVSAMLLAPCKVIYALVALLALFIPNERFGSKRKGILIKIACGILIALSIVVFKMADIASLTGATATNVVDNDYNYRGEEYGYFYTLSDVIRQPIYFLIMYLRTFDYFGFEYLQRLVGGSLGWFQSDIASPYTFVVVLTILLLLSCLRSDDDDLVLTRAPRICGVFVFVIGVVLAMASMLFGWTFNTENIIYGVQGRYFLPYLLWFLLALRPKNITISINMSCITTYLMLIANLYNLIRIFSISLTI